MRVKATVDIPTGDMPTAKRQEFCGVAPCARSKPRHVTLPGYRDACQLLWPSGKANAYRLVSRGTSVQIRFGCPFSSKVVVCGHCLVTLSLTINETVKWLSSLAS